MLISRIDGQSKRSFSFGTKSLHGKPDCAPTTVGGCYIRDIGRAPVIEYSRDPLRWSSHGRGRLYWSKGLTPGGSYTFKQYPFAYNAEEFNQWYELVVSWVKKNSRSKHTGGLPVYYLSSAWRWHAWHIR
ncbi:MAG TPA: hypothetical protein VGG97_08620 [Bryobacteraceae bacterium]